MQHEAPQSRIFADEVGIHFGGHRKDVAIHWGEIASVDAARWDSTEGSRFLEIYVDHFGGVDFRFTDTEPGYEQVMASMEQHLIGFSREKVEAATSADQKIDASPIWQRDETLQPFKLRAPLVDPRDPTAAERVQMQSAHQASIATCEKILGRPLNPEEVACVYTGFENGQIVGSIAPPLCHLLIKR